ncbi:hypothetical protein MTR62_07040 [Novosphingobium sp. 1949]|uniref:Uncharacterized protein n=1 Tax=Novosphingobium organovorum TaxID=2930092 RepID=A0ABT0BBV9_9SPHN|nr:hypothetical protein [Novosphingobium organovorum]MCJ2182454.1 hypothetical protein [Novosphingobium organovorum]
MTIAQRELLSTMAMALLYGGKAFAQICTGQAPYGVQTYSFRDILPTSGDMVDKVIADRRSRPLHQRQLPPDPDDARVRI